MDAIVILISPFSFINLFLREKTLAESKEKEKTMELPYPRSIRHSGWLATLYGFTDLPD